MMDNKVINQEQFDKVYNLCRAYDPFTCYIEDYNQMKSADSANEKVKSKLDEILSEFGLSHSVLYYGVDCSNTMDEAKKNLVDYFKSNNISVDLPEEKEKRIWSEEEIKNLIQTNDKVLYGALKKLYAEQTQDEQRDGQTSHNNGVGFNGIDSRFLSSVSEFLLKKGFLTNKQKATTRKLLVKYNKQLTRLANS